jgi:hypothetical protein
MRCIAVLASIALAACATGSNDWTDDASGGDASSIDASDGANANDVANETRPDVRDVSSESPADVPLNDTVATDTTGPDVIFTDSPTPDIVLPDVGPLCPPGCLTSSDCASCSAGTNCCVSGTCMTGSACTTATDSGMCSAPGECLPGVVACPSGLHCCPPIDPSIPCGICFGGRLCPI